jgi:hypothetical protein
MMSENKDQDFFWFFMRNFPNLFHFVFPHHSPLPPHLPYILILFRSPVGWLVYQTQTATALVL